MDVKDLIKNQYYYMDFSGSYCVFKFIKLTEDLERPTIDFVSDYSSNSNKGQAIKKTSVYVGDRKPRLATNKEIKWFNECIDRGVYTPLKYYKYNECEIY